ncbi:hypothetical protein KPL71_012459 [Citrus sinensis]|uniref:Uncharacterized protein n=1 Tax=Citrus sinensis TaxID=2711 RepID=A0ACB8LB08_CITSI|nr:hypothetical protein KPL71_012459 [Citrus sinensis]
MEKIVMEKVVYDADLKLKNLVLVTQLNMVMQQLETFYNDLNPSTRLMVDASANGALLSKSYNEAYEILERIANNNYQWPSTRQAAARGTTRVHNIDALTALSAQVTSLTNMMKVMTTAPASINLVAEISCVYCGEEHLFDNCPGNPTSVNYVGIFNKQNQDNPYSNTYNTGWRQHPNFSWSYQNQTAAAPSGQNRPAQPPGFYQQNQEQRSINNDQLSSLEALIKDYIVKNKTVVQNHAASLRNLENQIGQLATTLSNRPQGSLPSNTEDPRREGKEHCKVINLRSGKDIDSSVGVPKEELSPTKAKKTLNVVNFFITEKLHSCCSKEEINVVTLEELDGEDHGAANIAWSGEKQPFRIDEQIQQRELTPDQQEFKVNGLRVKHYLGADVNSLKRDRFLKDPG